MVNYPVKFTYAGFMPAHEHSSAQVTKIGKPLIIKEKSWRIDAGSQNGTKGIEREIDAEEMAGRDPRLCTARPRNSTGYPRWSRKDPIISAAAKDCDRLS
jgi:hypothetical protein